MKISAGTIARTIILVLALVNQVLVVLGINPITIGDETITDAVSLIFTIVAAVTSWWKNNSFTSKAIAADEYMKTISNESEVTEDEEEDVYEEDAP